MDEKPLPSSDIEPKQSDTQTCSKGTPPKLMLAEFNVYVDLYKFFLKMCLSVNVFYLAVLGGILTFLFRPTEKASSNLLTFVLPFVAGKQPERVIDTLDCPVKLIFLVTPLIISYVFILSFGLGAKYWWVSTRDINRKIKAVDEVELRLITTPFFHLLTILLVAVTVIFTFVSVMLVWIIIKYKILFCADCCLRPAILLEVGIVLVVVVGLSLVLVRFGTKPTNQLREIVKPPLAALLWTFIFIVSTVILFRGGSVVFHPTSDILNWIPVITAIGSAIGTISTIIFGWRNDKRAKQKSDFEIAQLQEDLKKAREKPPKEDEVKPGMKKGIENAKEDAAEPPVGKAIEDGKDDEAGSDEGSED